MKLSHKDKSFLLFVAASLVVLWVIFSIFSSLFFSVTFAVSDVQKLEVKDSKKWLNVLRPLEASDLKDRVILLDFWSYSCVSCVQILPEIKELEDRFGSKITIIAVHSGRFQNEKDREAVRKAILKYDITYPVINDPDSTIWNSFQVKELPSFVLINPHGNIVKTYSGAVKFDDVKRDTKKLISKYRFQINRDPLPLAPEKFSVIDNVLSFPSKLTYVSNFSYKGRNLPVIFISNTGKNNIIVTSISGDMIVKIGSGRRGFEDGDFESASFDTPQGMAYYEGKLYVADFSNNALREIDFKTEQVTTILGSGYKGAAIKANDKNLEAKDVDLTSPTDVEFFPHGSYNLAISNSGTHQILSYNLKSQTISVLAGNGLEGGIDGKNPENSLAQPSDILAFNHKLYFVDATSSSLRVLNENGEVKTLIGGNLENSGHKNGGKSEALMQHPLGLLVDDTGAYISDSYNHKIRKYDFSSGRISDLIGSRRGEGVGSEKSTSFDEPDGIVAVLDRFYISDSNNNRILAVNRSHFNSELLDVMPPLQLPKEGFVQYLPNLQKSEDLRVKSDEGIALKIKINEGWKINEAGPSFINLLEIIKDDQAELVASFDWHQVRAKEAKLPKLREGRDYMLQGVIYYCEDKVNALCYVKSYEQKLITAADEKNSQVVVKLAY